MLQVIIDTYYMNRKDDVIGKVDVTMKEWLEIPEVFAELFNGAVFRECRRIEYEELTERNTDCVVSIQSKDGKEMYTEKFRDVVNKYNSEMGLVLLAVENQDDICNVMPVRNMMYDAITYEKNIREIVAGNEKEGKKVSVTRVIEKGQKIVPVVTLVLYTGMDKWDGPTTLSEMWDISDTTRDMLKNELNDYKIHVIDANHMKKEEINNYESDARKFFLTLHLLNEEKSLKDTDEDITVKYSKTAKAIGIVRNKKDCYKIIEEGKGVVDMKQIEDVWFEEGQRKGEIVGEKKGEQKQLIGMVCKKLNKNKSPELIADELEEEIEVINNICNVAERVAPEYDVETIYEMLHEDTKYGE